MKLLFARIRVCIVTHTLIASNNDFKYSDIGIWKFNCYNLIILQNVTNFKCFVMDIYLENDSLFERADTICLSEHLPKLKSYYVDERYSN